MPQAKDRRPLARVTRAVVLALALVTAGCQPARLHAKDLLYHSSAAVRVPSWTIFWLFGAAPMVAWLPISGPVLGIVQGEPAIWFALGPAIVVAGPILFLVGTPLRWIAGPSDPPPSDEPPKPPAQAPKSE